MPKLLDTLFSRIFGETDTTPPLPDDGGLGEFARQLAKDLAEEEKNGKRPTVSADDVLKVQQGAHGSKAYMIDTTDFKNAIAPELRESIAPVVKGILKSRCGQLGKGYMNVRAIYIFSIRRDDATEEFNAVMDIIDDIGKRLLGDRYLKGDRLNVPVAKVIPDKFFTKKGGFNFKKAKEVIKWVREANTHGPVDIDWKTKTVQPTIGSPEWVENSHISATETKNDWEQDANKAPKEDLGPWKDIHHEKTDTNNKDWESIEFSKPKEEPKLIQTLPKKQPAPPKTISSKQSKSMLLVFRPCWHSANEEINCFAIQPITKISGKTVSGQQVYIDADNTEAILDIDREIVEKSIQLCEAHAALKEIKLVVPLHFESLSLEKNLSPILPFFEKNKLFRKSIFLEIINLPTNASPHRIAAITSAYKDEFAGVGLRFELGDISRSIVERSQASFLSCDVDYSHFHSKHMRGLELDLPDLINLSKGFGLPVYAWGIHSKKDLMFALRKGAHMISGNALAREQKTIGEITPIPTSQLMSL